MSGSKAFAYAKPEHVPGNFRGDEVVNAVNQNLASIWTGKASVEAGAKATHEAVQAILDKPAD